MSCLHIAEAGADLAWIQEDEGALLTQLATGAQLEVLSKLISLGWPLPSAGIQNLFESTVSTCMKDSGRRNPAKVSDCRVHIKDKPVSSRHAAQ